VRSLSSVYKLRSSCWTSVSDFDSEDKNLRLGIEILITTPGRLFELIKKSSETSETKKQKIYFHDLQTLILDEVDILFLDKSFPLTPIGEMCSKETQFLFTSATLPSEVTKQILREFPETQTLYGPGLHRTSPNIEEKLIDCSGDFTHKRSYDIVLENKLNALQKLLTENAHIDRTLIFCNSIKQCRNVENFLSRDDRHHRIRDIFSYHSAIENAQRKEHLVSFTKTLLKKPVVLICTDRTSRGMDFYRSQVGFLFCCCHFLFFIFSFFWLHS
jgi:ATP-dependent RNA helicase DDX18/HAS1